MNENNKIVKVILNASPEVVSTITDLAAKRGTTMAHVLSQAIVNYEFLEDIHRDGGKVLVEDRYGKLREIVFPAWFDSSVDRG